MDPDGTLHHGVLAHEHHGVATQTLANVLELVGSDVVGRHNQDLAVLVQQLAQLPIVRDLLVGLREFSHDFPTMLWVFSERT